MLADRMYAILNILMSESSRPYITR